jgi:hypothetical protein
MSIWKVYDAFGNIIEQGTNAAANAHDGNTSTYYTLYAPEVAGSPYIIEEDFGQPLTITQFKVYPTLDEYSYGYSWVRVEYWTGSGWALVGDATNNNDWNVFSGSWTTSKWRVRWAGSFDPEFGYGFSVGINEMQAVAGTTTINVSDSGTGTESVVKLIDGAMEVVDSGTGTESATKIAFGSTWTVYDAFGNILEQGTDAAATAHDGDISTYYTLYPPPPYGPYDQPYIIEEDFGQTLTVTQFKVYATYVDVNSQIRVEYWTGSAWAFVGYVTTADTWTTFSGSWTTNKWRVSWSGNPYAGGSVRVNEMQAVQVGGEQSLTVSDSGTGTDLLSNILRSVGDAGVGAETSALWSILEVQDGGLGSETIVGGLLFDVTDTGVGMESIGQEIGGVTLFTPTDSGIGVELLRLDRDGVMDGGVGTETATLSAVISVTDGGVAADGAFAIIYLDATDSGWGTEEPLVSAVLYATDTGEGTELLSREIELDDFATASDLGEFLWGVTDEGLGVEDIPLRHVGCVENGVGQEEAVVTIIVRDGGFGQEIANAINFVSVSDNGAGQEKPLRVIHIGAFVFLRPD